MSKDEILEKSRHEKSDEINEYIDNKTSLYSSLIFLITCILMMVLAFQSPQQAEIFNTTATLFTSFLCIYCWMRYYYLKSIIYFILGIVLFGSAGYFMTQVWMLIW